jgi:prepilin peptidase CpaA
MTLFQGIVIGVAGVAALCDLKTRRIPNALTFGAALAAVVAHGYVEGWSGAGTSVLGWTVGVAAFFPFFALGGLGAGDIKLLGAIGAWLGPVAAVWVVLFSGIAGGVLAVLVALFSGYLVRAFSNVWGLLTYWRVMGLRSSPELTLVNEAAPRLAYAVPVFAGTVLTLWLR